MSLDSHSSHSFEESLSVVKKHKNEPLSECVKQALDNYFKHLDGHNINNLHQIVLREVEPPMFERVMRYTKGNQSKAAKLLGISRSTLRKKLAQYAID